METVLCRHLGDTVMRAIVLKLVPKKATVKILVVDRHERPTGN